MIRDHLTTEERAAVQSRIRASAQAAERVALDKMIAQLEAIRDRDDGSPLPERTARGLECFDELSELWDEAAAAWDDWRALEEP